MPRLTGFLSFEFYSSDCSVDSEMITCFIILWLPRQKRSCSVRRTSCGVSCHSSPRVLGLCDRSDAALDLGGIVRRTLSPFLILYLDSDCQRPCATANPSRFRPLRSFQLSWHLWFGRGRAKHSFFYDFEIPF